MSICSIFVIQYPQDHARWTRILEEGPNHLPKIKNSLRDVSKLSTDLRLGQWKQSTANETQFTNKQAESMKNRMKLIVNRLKGSVEKVEYDVHNLDVNLTLNAITEVPLEENRLIHKIQRALRYPEEKCVIRLAKYCAKRCDHLVQGNHSREWTRFDCDFVSSCRIETRFVGNLTTHIMQTVDVLLVVDSLHDGLQLKTLMDIRSKGQLWVLYSRENPIHDAEYAPPGLTGNPFNLTITYSRDSDIPIPYCFFQKKKIRPPPIPKKTKLIAWVASNCRLLSWRRSEFVKELQKHISVDTYGKCGDMGQLSVQDAAKTLKQYKFYLAFESGECRDYITEKIWRTCLLQGIVPIVYGASRKDYEQVMPRNSFIHIEDYSNMSAFVDYIHALHSDEDRYKKYFDWRAEGIATCISGRQFIMLSPEVNLCYLLRKLIHVYIHPETSWKKQTPDFASWWRGQCREVTAKRNILGFPVHQYRNTSR